MKHLASESGSGESLPPPGVSIEVAAGLRREGRVVWGHLRFDRGGLRFRPRGAGGYVWLALDEVDAVRSGAPATLEVDAGGRTWSWMGEGGRRIHRALLAARGQEAA